MLDTRLLDTSLLDTRRPRLLLSLLCLLCWVPGFFTLPPGDRDESRFAQATKQMLETGDFVRILNGEEERNRKPIGIHWLQAPFVAAARATGAADANPIWPYRIPSALGGWIAVLATFSAGEALLGRRTALLAAGMLAASLILAVETHIAKTDSALLGACTVALGVLARAYRGDPVGPGRAALFWLALGAGVLLKGPVSPMVAGLPALALSIADRRWGWLRALHPGWGVPLLLLVVLPWFVAIGVATDGRFFADAVGGDLGRKIAQGDDAHWGPPGEHLLLLPLLLFPASLAIPGAVRTAWRERREPAVRFLVAWVVPAWIVFEAVPTKLPHYTLPLLPAVCLLAARSLIAAQTGWLARALPVLAAAVVFAAAVALPFVLHVSPWLAAPAGVAAAVVAAFALRGSGPVRMGWALATAPLLYWAVLGFELPHLAPLWIAPRVAAIRPAGPFGAVGYHEPSLMFAAGTDTQWIATAPEGAVALQSGQVHSLLVADRDVPAFEAAAARAGLSPREVGQVSGFNYSRGRQVVLTLFEKQGDQDAVSAGPHARP